MNKHSKQELNERSKNTAKQTKRISATFGINNCPFSPYLSIERFRRLATKFFFTESMPKCTHICSSIVEKYAIQKKSKLNENHCSEECSTATKYRLSSTERRDELGEL